MSADKRTIIRIDLTAEPRQQTDNASAGALASLELGTVELEQRIAPFQTLSSAISDVMKNLGGALQTAARA